MGESGVGRALTGAAWPDGDHVAVAELVEDRGGEQSPAIQPVVVAGHHHHAWSLDRQQLLVGVQVGGVPVDPVAEPGGPHPRLAIPEGFDHGQLQLVSDRDGGDAGTVGDRVPECIEGGERPPRRGALGGTGLEGSDEPDRPIEPEERSTSELREVLAVPEATRARRSTASGWLVVTPPWNW